MAHELLLDLARFATRAIPALCSQQVREDWRFIRGWKQFRERTGAAPRLVFPRTFNDKMQWLKLFDRKTDYFRIADKLAVRQYVTERIGEQFLNRLYAVYRSVNEIDLSSLPERFVLKTTHASGWNVICRCKAELDWAAQCERLRGWISQNFYLLGREWVYSGISPAIMAEQFLDDPDHGVPPDYKFFCFHGQPLLIQVDVDRFSEHRRAFYSPCWERQPFTLMYPAPAQEIAPPQSLYLMLGCAAKLSAGFKFIRVDFYEVKGRVIFGEMTFYPECGSGTFTPSEYDGRLGQMIRL